MERLEAGVCAGMGQRPAVFAWLIHAKGNLSMVSPRVGVVMRFRRS